MQGLDDPLRVQRRRTADASTSHPSAGDAGSTAATRARSSTGSARAEHGARPRTAPPSAPPRARLRAAACSSPGARLVRRNASSACSGFVTRSAPVSPISSRSSCGREREEPGLAQPRPHEDVAQRGARTRTPAASRRPGGRWAGSTRCGRSPGSGRPPRSGRPRARCPPGSRAPRPRSGPRRRRGRVMPRRLEHRGGVGGVTS